MFGLFKYLEKREKRESLKKLLKDLKIKLEATLLCYSESDKTDPDNINFYFCEVNNIKSQIKDIEQKLIEL